MKTIYQLAQEIMEVEIARYIKLLEATDGLKNIEMTTLEDEKTALLFAAGIGSDLPEKTVEIPEYLIAEHNRKAAIDFDVEQAVCTGVYTALRPYAEELYEIAKKESNNFNSFSAEEIKSAPFLLPVLQSCLKLSKSQLKKVVGSVSDNSISAPASVKLADLLNSRLKPNDFAKESVLSRMEITLEGIVRDLVGRVLFEDVVAYALTNQGVNFMRENEYTSIAGVVYDFRADFILPNPDEPIAFIEVRKSSSRHASLYAKDKMFSAINWKGKHKNLIGVIVVEGEWTQATLKIMSSVFDYVVPLSKSAELAKLLKSAQDGDKSILKWLIDFSIKPSTDFAANELT